MPRMWLDHHMADRTDAVAAGYKTQKELPMFTTRRFILAIVAAALLIAGCETNSSRLIPNPDRDLNKTMAKFSADAAGRKYPTTEPSPVATTAPAQMERAPFRGEVDYQLRVINIVNLSDTPWNDVEVWANGKYVCFVPTFPAKMQRGIAFRILFSSDGSRPPLKGLWLQKVELVKDGVIYSVPIFAAD